MGQTQLSQNPPQGIQNQLAWCIAWIYQLRGRLGQEEGNVSQPTNQIVVGNGSGITSYPDLIYNTLSTIFSVGFGGNPYLFIGGVNYTQDPNNLVFGDFNGAYSGLGFNVNWGILSENFVINDNDSDYLVINPIIGMYGLGDGIGVTPRDHGTQLLINDITQRVTITNVPSYSNDAVAEAAGLTVGQLYRTTVGGITTLCIVP